MLEITISFSNLSDDEALYLADMYGCDMMFDGTFHDLISRVTETLSEEWSRDMINAGTNLGGTCVAIISDYVTE